MKRARSTAEAIAYVHALGLVTETVPFNTPTRQRFRKIESMTIGADSVTFVGTIGGAYRGSPITARRS